MPAEFEYKSVMREYAFPSDYEDAGPFLASYTADGWDLITVLAGQFVKTTSQYEIFYLRRKIPGGIP